MLLPVLERVGKTFVIALLLACGAGNRAAADCPSPADPSAEIQAFRAQIRPITDEITRRRARRDDGLSEEGTLIDSSCYGRAGRYPGFGELIERAVALAVRQAERCGELIGFAEIEPAISVLRASVIDCRSRRYVKDQTWRGQSSPLRRSGVDLTHWRVALSPNPELVIELNREAFDSGPGHERSNLFNMAETLFHESLHYLPTLNTHWHNDPEMGEERRSLGRSDLDDRVRFISKACFAESGVYSQFEARLNPVRETCETALTLVEPKLRARYDGVTIRGRSDLAIPYPRDEAERVCSNVGRLAGIERLRIGEGF